MPSRTPSASCWKRLLQGALLCSCVSVATLADACPSCPVGQEARRQVWRDRFIDNLAVTLLPFLIIGAVSARVHHIGRPRGSHPS